MADANVPIKFEIYKGDQLVREEVLAQSPIKIGKLASSDLRLDDETVSRMHGVIEATGPGDVHVVDLGSTRGTTGQRRARHEGAAAVRRRGHVRRLPRHRHVRRRDAGAGDPRPAGVGWRPSGRAAPGGYAAPPPMAYAPPPQQQYAPPPQQSYQQPAVVRAAVVRGRAGRGRRGRGPRRFARDGGSDHLPRRRHRDPPPVQPGRKEHARPGYVDAVRRPRRPPCSAIGVFVSRQWTSARRRRASSSGPWRGKDAEELHLEGPFRRQRRDRVRRPARQHRAGVHGPQAARQDQPELPRRLRRRRRRAGRRPSTCRRRRTRWSQRPAPTTSSTSPRA